jgi:hypothetical protein
MASETFSYTGSEQTWTVPNGVDNVDIECWGAGGGHSGNFDGGVGGYAKSTNISVTPGETLYIYVGGRGNNGDYNYSGDGQGGWNGGGDSDPDASDIGGGGGGASDVRQAGNTLSDRVVIAGGGGGAAASKYFEGSFDGGDGGGSSGQDGDSHESGSEGAGGTQSAGGSGGTDTHNGNDGSLGVGGNGGGYNNYGGGGGGGGYYGGGGGAGSDNTGDSGGGGGGSGLGGTLTAGGGNSGDGEVTISYTQEPAAPNNVSATVDANDAITVSWDTDTSQGTPDHYDIELSRDGSNYQPPSDIATVTHDGSTAYSITENPVSDQSYQSQVGVDSSFRVRVNAENSAGSSSWSYTGTVYTDPIPSHAPSVSRSDGSSITINWANQSDIEDGVEVQYREDSGSGYGAWTTAATTAAGATSWSTMSLPADVRRQWRVRTVAPDGATSDWAYADYGNQGNVYFADDFEDADLAEWDATSLSDADSGVVNNQATTNTGISGSEQGSYHLRLDAEDSVTKNLGDLSGESDVLVRCFMATGSMDDSGEWSAIWWYDGSAWNDLEAHGWEYNRQGWVQVTAVVPDSWLSTDNRLRLTGDGGLGGGDHTVYDDVVVSDLLHEYTTPAAPSGLSVDASVEDELTALWTENASFEDDYLADIKETSASSYTTDATLAAGSTSHTYGALEDGERYDIRPVARVEQDRQGARSTRWTASVSGAATTVLPAPTSLAETGHDATTIGVSWTDNHDYGDTKVQYKPTDAPSWSTFSTISRNTESETITGLRTGEKYDIRVLANTEHTQTEDA